MITDLSPMSAERTRAVRAMLVDQTQPAEDSAKRARTIDRGTISSGWRRRQLLGALATVTAIVVAAVGITTSKPATQPAFASWTAVPLAIPTGQSDKIETWASRCRKLTGAGIGVGGVPKRAREAAMRDILIDRRGDYLLCLDVAVGTGQPTDPLIAHAGIKGPDVSQGFGTTDDQPYRPPTGSNVVVLHGDYGPEPTNGPPSTYHATFGHVGEAVTGVDIVVDGHAVITASVQHGLWAAWWPHTAGSQRVTALILRTPTGTRQIDPKTVTLR